MRNLLGRLHARPAAELTRIAAYWQVPVGGGDRHAQVGALYRVMIDPRAVRSVWERLAPDERALVRLLALDEAEAAPTLAELAARLGVTEAEARDTAVALYRAGILARERDDEPLPVGEVPRLFLPRELALLFRRVQDEIEAGDLSATPLRALLELLDDAEIEEAAAIWGIKVVPGLRERDDLTTQLLRRVGDPARVARVAAGRRRDAARLWRRVADEPDGAPVALAVAAADAGLGGDDARSAHRLRAALAELEASLLVWHTYRSDGSRWLFVPKDLRSPGPPAESTLPPFEPVAASAVEPPPWRHPGAVAWDLLTLLRELADREAPPWPASADPPLARLRRLNARFWHRGPDVPPAGYVDFLLALGLAEGLVSRGDGRHPTLAVAASAPAVRAWRDRSFAQQMEQLRGRWLASADWIEGRSRGEVEVWGADWRGARRGLVTLLADPAIGLDRDTWHGLDSVATRIAACDPGLLGATVTVATARHAVEAGTDARLAAVAEVVAVELTTAFVWFGLVEVAHVPGRTRAVRVTDAGLALSRGTAVPTDAEGEEAGRPPVVVTPGGEARLLAPTPFRVWALSAFAEPERLDRVSVYRLTAAALHRALAAGVDLDQVLAFLTRQAGSAPPPDVAAQLVAWARGYRRVRLHRAVVLVPDDPSAVPDLGRLASEMGLAVWSLGEQALVVEFSPDEDGDAAEASLVTRLRERDYSPLWAKPAAAQAQGKSTRPEGVTDSPPPERKAT